MIRKEKNRGNPRHSVVWVGRSERIRTSDPCVPNAVLYQAELHSDSCVSNFFFGSFNACINGSGSKNDAGYAF